MNINIWKAIYNVETNTEKKEDLYFCRATIYKIAIRESGEADYLPIDSSPAISYTSPEAAEQEAIEEICKEAGIPSPYKQ